MTDQTQDRESLPKSWWSQFPSIIAIAITSAIVGYFASFPTKVIDTGQTSAVLNSQVQQIISDLREQKNDQKDLNKSVQEILVKTGNLYSQEDARRDREAFERRFQGIDGRIAELIRRVETLESTYRILIDRATTQPQPLRK